MGKLHLGDFPRNQDLKGLEFIKVNTWLEEVYQFRNLNQKIFWLGRREDWIGSRFKNPGKGFQRLLEVQGKEGFWKGGLRKGGLEERKGLGRKVLEKKEALRRRDCPG